MTGYDESQQDLQNLRQLFAQRVDNQVQLMQEVWQDLQVAGRWRAENLTELMTAAARLRGYAERFNQPQYEDLAVAIQQCLQALIANHGNESSPLALELGSLMQRLAQTGLRAGDEADDRPLRPLRRPIYLALSNLPLSRRLARQLEFYGFTALVLEDEAAFHNAMLARRPAALVMEAGFAGNAMLLTAGVQDADDPLPVLFYSAQEADIRTRLEAVRAGGLDFFCGNIEASTLLERIEELASSRPREPYRVLVVDDSRAQAMFTERILLSAGLECRLLLEPLQTLDVIDEFQPDLLILDMYMPECNGPELARVIRYDTRHGALPIIFLSGEEDLDKQLDAMNGSGGDFLCKPVRPNQLIATVKNRAARARLLMTQRTHDGLTGLVNHSHFLHLLDAACQRAHLGRNQLCMAMLDIDGFQQINDEFGHGLGDQVLRSLALLLRKRLRSTDVIGRYGGDEFALVLPVTDVLSAVQVMEQIRTRFAEIHFQAEPRGFSCTLSIGLVMFEGSMDARQMARLAGMALYQAKARGRNRVKIYRASGRT